MGKNSKTIFHFILSIIIIYNVFVYSLTITSSIWIPVDKEDFKIEKSNYFVKRDWCFIELLSNSSILNILLISTAGLIAKNEFKKDSFKK